MNCSVLKADMSSLSKLTEYIESVNVAAFTTGLESQWQDRNKHFKQVQADLAATLQRHQVSPVKFMVFVCNCVLHLMDRAAAQTSRQQDGASPATRGFESGEPTDPQQVFDKWTDSPRRIDRRNPWKPTHAPMTGTEAALCHLLLESVPPPLCLPSAVASPEVQRAAAGLFDTCLTRHNARLAVKVAACFGLGIKSTGSPAGVDVGLLTSSVQDMLGNRHLVGPAVSLVMQFPGLAVEFDPLGGMLVLIEDGQLAMAQKWAAELGSETQEQLVQSCIDAGNLKDACKLVSDWGLQPVFPDLEEQYRQHTMQKLLGKCLWNAAAGFASGNTKLQRQLVTALAVHGEAALAETYCTQFELDPEGLPLQGDALEASRNARDAMFYPLSLPAERIHFVHTAEGVTCAGDLLQAAPVIGLDVEWRPDNLKQKSPASILQIASLEHAFLFDLMALHANPALDGLLKELFQSRDIIKLSMDASQDFKKIASSYPEMTAFQEVNTVLNMANLWILFNSKPGRQRVSQSKKRQVGLSTIVEGVLGKPLDKSMQLSDWERRPLTERQTQYAALDALVQVEVYNAVLQDAGSEAEALLAGSFMDMQRPSNKRKPSSDEPLGGGGGGATAPVPIDFDDKRVQALPGNLIPAADAPGSRLSCSSCRAWQPCGLQSHTSTSTSRALDFATFRFRIGTRQPAWRLFTDSAWQGRQTARPELACRSASQVWDRRRAVAGVHQPPKCRSTGSGRASAWQRLLTGRAVLRPPCLPHRKAQLLSMSCHTCSKLARTNAWRRQSAARALLACRA